MNVIVDVVNASGDEEVPVSEDFQRWAAAALTRIAPDGDAGELSVRIVDEAESAHLNERYRGKAGATNVLSFPFSGYRPEDVVLMGDVAICAPVVRREAADQSKDLKAHWAHLCVHGMLHLHGYDHEDENQAETMEQLETAILNELGYADPYHETRA